MRRIKRSTQSVSPLRGFAQGARSLLLIVLALLRPAAAQAADWPPAPPLVVAPDDQPGALPPSITAETVRPGAWRCTFQFKPEGSVRSVSLAGTFNGWNPGALPMKGPDAEGRWSAQVELAAGVHLYKFVVDSERWFSDPRNPNSVPDGHSGQNSVLRLGRIANMKVSPAKVGDGQIEGLALEHNPNRARYFQALGTARALVRYRTLAHDVEKVTFVSRAGLSADLRPVDEDAQFTLWEGQVRLFPPSQKLADDMIILADLASVHYTFVLADGNTRVSDPTTYHATVLSDEVFHTPDWAKHAVWYQIFPDRFRNGNPANDRQPVRPWTSEWFTPSPWEREKEKEGQTFYKFYVFDRQYGGDIDGIEQELPYLKGLGVNALYLNPIFESESNHKYNTSNYLHVDQHFGTLGDYAAVAAKEDLLDPGTWQWTESDKRFLRFLKKAHAMGFKVILDGVFNHVGVLHPAFQDVKKNGRNSRFADWFDVTSWEPFKYNGWAGFDALPAFKKSKDGLASPSAQAHIFNVTRRWLAPDGDPTAGIDGWRLDVPNEIAAPFWVEWRQLVKSINPDAYISGEIWDRADAWLDGRHFDAVMNYEFARAVVAWVFNHKQKITVREFDRRLRELRLAYPLEATLVLQNLLDSHDTDRVASMAHNPDRAYDAANRVQDNGPKYDNSEPSPEDYARVRLAVLIEMTYIGAPMIYYGDEAGMWGADDPTNRKPMLWEDLEPYEKPEENFVLKDHRAFYAQAIALRTAHPALQTGAFRTLLADDQADVWAFLRSDDNEQLVVVLNASDQEREVSVPLPAESPHKWQGVFGVNAGFEAADHALRVRVPPVAGVALHAATPK